MAEHTTMSSLKTSGAHPEVFQVEEQVAVVSNPVLPEHTSAPLWAIWVRKQHPQLFMHCGAGDISAYLRMCDENIMLFLLVGIKSERRFPDSLF